ncbi:MAG: hypothetical protein WDZ40_03575 [Candidatus Spechtbacterales bacterium]
MSKEKIPKIEDVANKENWEDANVTYEFKDGKYIVGRIEITGLEYLSKFEMTSEEEDKFFNAIYKLFALNNFNLEEKEVEQDIGREQPIRKLVRKITINFSPEAPKKWYQEHKKELVITGKWNQSGQNIKPDPSILDKQKELKDMYPDTYPGEYKDPSEGFMEEYTGSVTIYPNNISDKSELYITTFHELAHVTQKWQGRSFMLNTPIGAKYGEEPHEVEAENVGKKFAEMLLESKNNKKHKTKFKKR